MWQTLAVFSRITHDTHSQVHSQRRLTYITRHAVHEGRLRCPDDVSGDMQEDEIPGGALSLYLLTTQTTVTTGIFPCKEKFPW